MGRLRLAALSLGIVVLPADGLLALEGAEKTLTVERAVPGGGPLVFENLIGSVRIVAARPLEPVRVEAHVTAEARTIEEARALVESIRIEQRATDGEALFHVVFPVADHAAFRPPKPGVQGLVSRWTAPLLRESSTVEYGGRTVEVGPDRKATGLAVNLTISLPYDSRATVRQGAGPIHGRALRGHLQLATTDGDITVERCFGTVQAESRRGSVRILHFQGDGLEVRTATGDTELSEVRTERTTVRTTAGSIRGSGVSTGLLVVESSTGDVRVADCEPATARIETGSGKVDVSTHWTRLKDASIRTAGGDVTLRVGNLTHFDLLAQSRTGTVQALGMSLDLVEREGLSTRLRQGQGGPAVLVEAPGGSITVRPYDASRLDLLVRER